MYLNAKKVGAYAVRNLYWKSHIHLKDVGKQFFLKKKMTRENRNLIYVVICSTCKEEHIGETKIGDSKLRDRVRICMQHIRKPEHEKLKAKRHLRTCSKGNLTIFLLLQLRSYDTGLRQKYED